MKQILHEDSLPIEVCRGVQSKAGNSIRFDFDTINAFSNGIEMNPMERAADDGLRSDLSEDALVYPCFCNGVDVVPGGSRNSSLLTSTSTPKI